MQLISVVINTFNEEANIEDCIRSVQSFADEIVVCDMNSTDKTVEIARTAGARISLANTEYCDFGRLRYAAVIEARNPWILVIDADERLTVNLANKLREIANTNQVDVVFLSSLYWYFGGWVRHGGFFTSNWPRFFRRSAYLERYVDKDEMVHRDLSILMDVANRLVLSKDYFIEHFAYPTIEKYVNKTIGMYARVEAEHMYKAGLRFSKRRLLLEPVKFFLSNYLRRQGYRDGMRGFILSVLFSAYRFAIWANLWHLSQTNEQ